MKGKKIIAAVLGSALALSTAAGLAACSKIEKGGLNELGTTTLNVADYAVDYPTSSTDTAIKYTGTKILDFDTIQYYTRNSDGTIWVYRNYKDDGYYSSYTYDVYSIIAEKMIAYELYSEPSFTTWGGINVIRCIYSLSYESAYISYDGTILLPKAEYIEARGSMISCYLDGEAKQSQVFKVEGAFRNADDSVGYIVDYYKPTYDAKNGNYKLTKISENSIKLFDDDKYGSGATMSALNKIYRSTEEHPVEGAIADYEYIDIGNTYTFYKNGAVTGSVSIEGGSAVGFVGDYFYYSTYKSVSPDATSGYNVLVVDGDEQVKQKYTLHRYDIVANKSTELNYNVVVTEILPLYNSAKKAYDAAAVTCGKMTDGVLYIGYGDVVSAVYATDSELRVAYDVTGFAGAFDGIYKLADDRYAVGNYIVDGDLNYVYKYTINGYGNLYADVGLIAFNVNGYYGFTDLEGKIVYEPRYSNGGSSIKFNGGFACVFERQDNGDTKVAVIDGKGNVRYLPDGDDTEVNTFSNFYTVYEKVGNSYTFGVYNLDGSTIKEFKNLSSNDNIYAQRYGGCYCIRYNADVYKLV